MSRLRKFAGHWTADLLLWMPVFIAVQWTIRAAFDGYWIAQVAVASVPAFYVARAASRRLERYAKTEATR